jgi:hypothetical protein
VLLHDVAVLDLLITVRNTQTLLLLLLPAGVRSGDLEEAVAGNSTIYGINAVVLATAAGLAAYNPGLVRPDWPVHSTACTVA